MPVARAARLANLDQLCARLRTRRRCNALAEKVIEASSPPNETLFFPGHRALRRVAAIDSQLPHGDQTAKNLPIWSAAASPPGKRRRSIYMLIRELGTDGRLIDILGTDLSDQILNRAREAK